VFNLRIERNGGKVEIEVWEGEARIFQAEMPMKDIHDRSAIETAFGSADNILHSKVIDWIIRNTPIKS